MMKSAFVRFLVIGAVGVVGSLGPTPVKAGTIIDDWGSVKAEPAPALKQVTIDTRTTALLVMDLVTGGCNNERRPRCVASIPAVAKFLNEARTKGALVIHTMTTLATVADILPDVAPKAGEPVLTGGANKFIGTDLERILRDKGITTVITVGTSAHGVVLYTSSDAAFRGFKVVVPVDGMSSENLYAEQAVAWILTSAAGVSQKTTLTKFEFMKF